MRYWLCMRGFGPPNLTVALRSPMVRGRPHPGRRRVTMRVPVVWQLPLALRRVLRACIAVDEDGNPEGILPDIFPGGELCDKCLLARNFRTELS
jgi:hypothetical protein